MSGWIEFAAAMATFLATHFLPTRRRLRDRLIGLLGRRLYFSLYGIVSLAVVVWLIVAAGRAPYVGLWLQAGWHRWVPVLAMPVAMVLTVLAIGMPYPHTLGGRRSAVFDPARPGIAAVTRHPLLWALALWSGAHLVANGDVAHVLLFGGFAVLALAGMAVFDRRARAALRPGQWEEVRCRTAILSLRPLLDRGWLCANRRTLVRAVALGALIYAAVFLLHEPVIGITPLPG